MVTFYKITIATPYCEGISAYLATNNTEHLNDFVAECRNSETAEGAPNFYEYYGQEGFNSYEEYRDWYYANCKAIIEEVSREEYLRRY